MKLLAVNFHYFRETNYPSGIYPISRAGLEKQLDALHRRYRFVSQDQLAEWIKEQQFPDGDYCLLTFDDGLKEQMEAFELLESKGIPAVFYVSTDPVRSKTVLPTHQLHYIRTQLDDRAIYAHLEKNTAIATYPFDAQLLENQYRYDDFEARRVKYFLNFAMPETEKAVVIGQLFNALEPDEAAFSAAWYMNEQDLKRLADTGCLGSHGSAHLPLATLAPEIAEQDIIDSIQYLEAVGGKKVISFSYPFGGASAVSKDLKPMLQRAGITFAFTMTRSINTEVDLGDPFFLRRVDTNDAPGGKNPLPELC